MFLSGIDVANQGSTGEILLKLSQLSAACFCVRLLGSYEAFSNSAAVNCASSFRWRWPAVHALKSVSAFQDHS